LMPVACFSEEKHEKLPVHTCKNARADVLY